jgi:hypothetical protein
MQAIWARLLNATNSKLYLNETAALSLLFKSKVQKTQARRRVVPLIYRFFLFVNLLNASTLQQLVLCGDPLVLARNPTSYGI